MFHAVIATASLAVCGCATQPYLRSYAYDYTDHSRLAAERRAAQDMQDACYFSGAQYFEPKGPPKIVSQDGPSGRSFHATQVYDCVGTVTGP